MEQEKMVAMVNRIALFFASYPDDEAVPAVADHIDKFWEPRFRRQLDEYALAGGEGLHRLVMLGLTLLREPAAAAGHVWKDNPRSHGMPDPGARGSDAG